MGTRGEQLYAFSLPTEVLSNLKPRQLEIPESHPLHPNFKKNLLIDLPVEPKSSQLSLTVGGGAFNCALTGASFQDIASLKEHYKTDWYKYNVKLRSQGKPTGISEEQFDALVDGLSNSISGSDSSTSDAEASSSSSTNAVSRLMRKQQLGRGKEDDYLDEIGAPVGPRSALLWFEAPDAAPGTQYGVYRASLPITGRGKQRDDNAGALGELKALQLPSSISSGKGKGKGEEEVKERKWTLLMFGGGHFAGMVVSLAPKFVGRGKGKEKGREVVIIEKKTFHRYTTRRKQGGSQSANDNANGKAKSAGAQIRRHNETALTDEVRELLSSWSDEIGGSELIFLRASKTSYKTFFGYEGAVLDKKDPRIRGFSFPTRRPTISELLRAFNELTSIKTSHLSSEALAQLDAAYLTSITPAPPPVIASPKAIAPKPTVIKLTKEQELERDRWERLVDMTKKGKVEALAAFLDKYGPELEQSSGGETEFWGTLPSWMEESKITPTLLHVASAADQVELVRWLLVEKRANPTLAASYPPIPPQSPGHLLTDSTLSKQLLITNPDSTITTTTSITTRPILTPYELAPSRATRNVFRLLTTTNPDWWDWTGSGLDGARIPSGLNEEKEDEREQKGRDRRNKLKEKLKEREKERESKEAIERLETERIELERAEAERKELARTRGNKIVPTGPQRLGGAPSRAIARQMDAGTGVGLSEEQKGRIQREQRARAAEARMAKTE